MNAESRPSTTTVFRILVIDDNAAIHGDFDKILRPVTTGEQDLADAEAALFGGGPADAVSVRIEVDHAMQGREGLERVREAQAAGHPYAVAFVDVRMPPGWDGIETISHLWQYEPGLQVVVCTAYSDHSWAEIVRRLGTSDSFTILKKPFDPIEVLQLTHALARKWDLARQVGARLERLDDELRRRAVELEESNRRLLVEMEQKDHVTAALRASEARFSSAFLASPVPMAILDGRDLRIVAVNPALETVSGKGRTALVNRTITDSGLFRTTAELERECRQVISGARVEQQAHELITHATGERSTLVSITAIGSISEPHLLVVVEDISERIALQKHLLHASKMEAVGQLAAGIAHDFNNLLAVIQGHASLSGGTEGIPREVADSLAEILSASQRATILTRQLLAFSRRHVLQRRAIDVNTTLRGIESVLLRLAGPEIAVSWELAEHLPRVHADAGCVEQIVVNLIMNARDAMPGGGRIRIATGRHTADVEEAARHKDRRPGDYVRIAIHDSGTGIAPEIASRIFEPFFTTKDFGSGAGLGLSTVYGILRQHGGWITFDTQIGRGTMFEFCLPVAVQEEATRDEPRLPQGRPGARPAVRALLAEDDASVRNLTSMMLQRVGFNVVAAENGVEAERIFAGTPGNFDLLVTDVVMPGGVTGTELATRLRAARADLPIVVMSGYTLDVMEDFETKLKGAVFLQKPFSQDEFVMAIARARRGVEAGR